MFLNELFEAGSKHVTFCFGRMNPPTLGHKQVFDTMKSQGGDMRIFVSQTQDSKKNPLDYSTKLKFIKEMFPEYAKDVVDNPGLNTIVKVASYLFDQGYTAATFVAGSDRLDDLKKLLETYNGVEGKAHGYYKFEVLDFVSSGEREEDTDGIGGISASSAREAAANNNFEKFKEATGAGELSKSLFAAVRKGMKIEESKMKANEFLSEAKKDNKSVKSKKPRNFIAKNAIMGGAGIHKDKKKAEKQGDTKHKNKVFAEEGGEINISELEKKFAELEKRKEILRSAVEEARGITKDIKYDDTVMSIVNRIQALAEKTGVDMTDIKYAIQEVTEKANELESAVYALDDAFTDAYRSADYDASELEYEIDDYKKSQSRSV